MLGPPDGRFLVRAPGSDQLERVLALNTLGAPERRMLRGRKGRSIDQAEPEPVPTARATVIRPQPFEDEAEGERWLEALRGSGDRLEDELDAAVSVLNRAVYSHRCAQADPYARDVSVASALVVRLGYGPGEAVAEGRFGAGWELPRSGTRVQRSMEAPDERFASLLGGREAPLASEDLVLRARADLDAGRWRSGALQARIALEGLLAELPTLTESRRGPLEEDRSAIGAAANAALRGELDDTAREAVAGSLGHMEAALRAHRLGSGG